MVERPRVWQPAEQRLLYLSDLFIEKEHIRVLDVDTDTDTHRHLNHTDTDDEMWTLHIYLHLNEP